MAWRAVSARMFTFVPTIQSHLSPNGVLKAHQTKRRHNADFPHMNTDESPRGLTHRHPRAIGEHARRDIHRGQLLEQKLGRIRDVDLRDPVFVVAQPALEEALLKFTVIVSLAHRIGSII